jgi:hypothetical protein
MKRSHAAARRDALLQDIVSSLTENLVHFYHAKNHDDETTNPPAPPPVYVLEHWSRAAAQHAASAALIVGNSDDSTTIDNLVQDAMKIAMENWNRQISLNNPTTRETDEPVKAAPASFSLLDQFTSSGGGGLFGTASFFAWDNVRELEPFEKIKALQGVQYLEDVIPDWQQGGVQVHLQQGLACDAKDNNKSLSDEYLELHRKWFSWSRKSGEPETAQLAIDLIVNVFEAITRPSPLQGATASGNEAKTKRIMKLWWEMWMDIMVRGGGSGGGGGRAVSGSGDSRLTCIVQTIWSWMPALPPPPIGKVEEQEKRQSVAVLSERDELLFCLVMEIDPSAQWAYAWARIHPSWAGASSSIVLQAMNVSVLVPWVCHYNDAWTTIGQQQQQQDHDDNNSCFFLCIVSLLRSVLVSCRVSQFPWHLFELEEDSSSSFLGAQRSDAILALQDLFLAGLSQEQAESDADIFRICIEGMEVLLSGCRGGDNKTLFTKLVDNVESFVADNRQCGRRAEACEALQEMMERHLF